MVGGREGMDGVDVHDAGFSVRYGYIKGVTIYLVILSPCPVKSCLTSGDYYDHLPPRIY